MGKLKLINLEDIRPVEVQWLWKPNLPKGKVSILRGHPGEGKSMFMMALISALTNGDPLFNEEERRGPIVCVYQSAEDALDDTIRPRLDSAFAVCSRVFSIDEKDDPLSFTDARIEEAIKKTGAGLMVLDPLQAYMGANVDMYRANEVRSVLSGLVDIAQRTGCAILLVEHMNPRRRRKQRNAYFSLSTAFSVMFTRLAFCAMLHSAVMNFMYKRNIQKVV